MALSYFIEPHTFFQTGINFNRDTKLLFFLEVTFNYFNNSSVTFEPVYNILKIKNDLYLYKRNSLISNIIDNSLRI